MRILLDECVPRGLKRELPDYETSTVPEMGWAGKSNGELLALAEGEFDVLLTADQSVPFQQNLRLGRISVVTLRAKSSDIDELRPLIPQLKLALSNLPKGIAITVGLPSKGKRKWE